MLPAIPVGGLPAYLIGFSVFAIGWMYIGYSSIVTLARAVSGMMMKIAAVWRRISIEDSPGSSHKNQSLALHHESFRGFMAVTIDD